MQIVPVIASFNDEGQIKPLYVGINGEQYKVESYWVRRSFSNQIEFQCKLIKENMLKIFEHNVSKPLQWIGRHSFEIYLVHHRVLLLLLPLILPKVTNIYNQILFMIILFWLMCKLSEYLQILTNKVIDRINNVSFPKLKLPKICFKRKSKLE